MSRRSVWILLLVAIAGGVWAWRSFVPKHVANSPPPAGPIIAFGDSLTQGIGAGPGGTYPEQLSKLIGRPVINRGVAGETAEQALQRLDRDVLSQKPGVVLVCLGGNDLLQNKNPDAAFQALDSIVAQITDRGAMVVLIGVEGLMFVTENYGKRYKELVKRRQCLYVPDILKGIFSHGDLMSDGIHPNTAGYAIFAKRIADAMKHYL